MPAKNIAALALALLYLLTTQSMLSNNLSPASILVATVVGIFVAAFTLILLHLP